MGQAVASLAACIVWGTSPERLTAFAWRTAYNERRPATGAGWLLELDAYIAHGRSPRVAALGLLGRAFKLRLRACWHWRSLWNSRRHDVDFGAILIVSGLTESVEVSVAMDNGQWKTTWIMPSESKILIPELPRGTHALFTVTRSQQPSSIHGGHNDGHFTVRGRRRRSTTRRRPAQRFVVRPQEPISIPSLLAPDRPNSDARVV